MPSEMSMLQGHVAALRGARIAVVGDVMLDEFVRGDARRISPEAPVPVIEVRGVDKRLGGAANTAANVCALGGTANVVGLVGTDAEGDTVEALLREAGLGAMLVRDAARPTTRKMRLVARGQQMLRADFESVAPAAAAAENELLAKIEQAAGSADAFVLSDYAKGVVSERIAAHVIATARQHGLPVIVDPKRRDFLRYRGATIITPNLSELELAFGGPLTGESEVLAAAASLLATLDGAAILATRGADGMSLVRLGQEPVHVRAFARAVFDVTGAGDTVVATLALGLSRRVSMDDAIVLASVAAGVVVEKPGTATVSPEELMQALLTARR